MGKQVLVPVLVAALCVVLWVVFAADSAKDSDSGVASPDGSFALVPGSPPSEPGAAPEDASAAAPAALERQAAERVRRGKVRRRVTLDVAYQLVSETVAIGDRPRPVEHAEPVCLHAVRELVLLDDATALRSGFDGLVRKLERFESRIGSIECVAGAVPAALARRRSDLLFRGEVPPRVATFRVVGGAGMTSEIPGLEPDLDFAFLAPPTEGDSREVAARRLLPLLRPSGEPALEYLFGDGARPELHLFALDPVLAVGDEPTGELRIRGTVAGGDSASAVALELTLASHRDLTAWARRLPGSATDGRELREFAAVLELELRGEGVFDPTVGGYHSIELSGAVTLRVSIETLEPAEGMQIPTRRSLVFEGDLTLAIRTESAD